MKLFKVLTHLPNFIQKLPYDIAKNIVSLTLSNSTTQIWPRNSYVFNNIVCALSDLDFTIVIEDISEADIPVRKYKRLKKIFPFLGEINLYFKKELNSFSTITNYYEISRDPRLKKTLPTPADSSNIYQEIVFLCKTIESDQKNLRNIPHHRVKKWTHHLKLINQKSEVSLEELLSLLAKRCNELEISPTEFLKDFYKLDRTIKKNCDDFYRENSDKKNYILLYPFRWIGSSLTCDSFFHDIEELKTFTDEQLKLLEAQIEWEIWGLYSQYIHNLRQATLHTHLENIKQMMQTSIYLQESSVYDLLNKLISLHENLLLHYPRIDRP